jgi:hypothetical protein
MMRRFAVIGTETTWEDAVMSAPVPGTTEK